MKDRSSKVRIFGSHRSSDISFRFEQSLNKQVVWRIVKKTTVLHLFTYTRWSVLQSMLILIEIRNRFETFIFKAIWYGKVKRILELFIWVKWIWSKEIITDVNVVSFLIISDT